MKSVKNQKGLTLIELLGALTLAFILGASAFTILNNSLNFFQRETSRIDVRSQANIIATQLTTFYQQHMGFTIDNNGTGVKITDLEGTESREFSLPGQDISVYSQIRTQNGWETVEELRWEADARAEEEFVKILIRINELESSSDPFELETIVSRLN